MDTTPQPSVEPRLIGGRVIRLVALAAVAVLVAASCSDDASDEGAGAGSGDTEETTTTNPAVPAADGGADDPAFAEDGPFEVGVTTLELDDTLVEVWYPAADGASDGAEEASYDQLDALPAELAAAAPAFLETIDVAPEDLVTAMPDTYRDVASSADGPFPLVLFSHGFGSYRLDASAIMQGIASWGFVVAAPDHLNRGRAAVVTGSSEGDTEADVQTLLDTIQLVGDAQGPLDGLADTDTVGAVGHSAGGRAVLTALSEPEISVAVGWAAAGRGDGPPPEKPSMNIAARVDVLVPLEEVEETYDGLAAPKRLVVIDGAGHNSFTDLCLAVASGTDLFGIAERLDLGIPDNLVEGGKDGCTPEALDTELTWEITQNYTVGALRSGLGLDPADGPVALGDAVADEFPGAEIEYRTDLG